MSTSAESLERLMMLMVTVMQASTVVPMVVVWWRRKQFPDPIRLLSWYVYLSLAATLASRLLYPRFVPNNYWFNIGFNVGKVILFAGVYHQVFKRPTMQKLVIGLTAAAVGFVLVAMYVNLMGALSISRVVQCAVLSVFALIYLDQFNSRTAATVAGVQDPVWLLSVGYLVYCGITVSAYSLVYIPKTVHDGVFEYMFIAVGGLVLNYFLTLVFYEPAAPTRPRRKQCNTPKANWPASSGPAGSRYIMALRHSLGTRPLAHSLC